MWKGELRLPFFMEVAVSFGQTFNPNQHSVGYGFQRAQVIGAGGKHIMDVVGTHFHNCLQCLDQCAISATTGLSDPRGKTNKLRELSGPVYALGCRIWRFIIQTTFAYFSVD